MNAKKLIYLQEKNEKYKLKLEVDEDGKQYICQKHFRHISKALLGIFVKTG